MELLAPAGNMDCLHAAVRAGADAVYLGAQEFNARRGAGNFTLDELQEACHYAHLRGVRIYLTVNTVVLESEMKAALELVRQAYRRGVDAFIVQDLGLASRMRALLPEADLHISTQMDIHNMGGLAAAQRLGASRVTLARELSLTEVEALSEAAADAGMDIEVFAHGALCICYSGQCLMSSLVGGRSANRGRCAQPCRLPYELFNKAQRKALQVPGEYLLSPKDLCTIDLLGELAAAGVASLKIEGRMKSPEYVSAVTGVYRQVLDRLYEREEAVDQTSADEEASAENCAMDGAAVAEGEAAEDAEPAAQETVDQAAAAQEAPEPIRVHATDEEKRVLSEAFSRGFTQAYLVGETGNEMMSYQRPNNRGLLVGRVDSARGGVVRVKLDISVAAGDTLEFWTGRGHFAHLVTEQDIKNEAWLAISGPMGKTGRGDRVFRVREAAAAYVDDPLEPRIPVAGRVCLRIGEPLLVEFWPAHEAGNHVGERLVSNLADDAIAARPIGRCDGAVVEKARTRAVDRDDVISHVARMGTTPFSLAEGALDVELDAGVGISFSQLHKARAQALAALEEAIAPTSLRTLPHAAATVRPSTAHPKGCQVCAIATNPACARAARKGGADVIYIPTLNYKRGEAMVAGQQSPTVENGGYPKRSAFATPVVAHDPIEGTREERFEFNAETVIRDDATVLAENLGQLLAMRAKGIAVEAGPHIPVLNQAALDVLAETGVERVWLSPELTLSQIRELSKDKSASLGLFVAGAAELMVTEHCVLQSQGACNHNCRKCVRRKSPHFLKDRKGFEMPVITDRCGRSHIYNAVPLDLCHLMPDLIAAGVDAVMVDATLMNVEETGIAVRRAVRARDVALKTGDAIGKNADSTSGHIFRGLE